MNLSDRQLASLGQAAAKAVQKYFSNPENVKKYAEFKEREKKAVS